MSLFAMCIHWLLHCVLVTALPLAKGDVFGAAKFDSDSCLPHESYNITMTVRYIVVNPWFKSRPTVRVHVSTLTAVKYFLYKV